LKGRGTGSTIDTEKMCQGHVGGREGMVDCVVAEGFKA